MKLATLSFRSFFPLCFLLFSVNKLSAQTQPVPFDLSSGDFHFNSWDSLATAGTYPEGMIFQFVPANRIAPFYNDSSSDYSCPYNMTKRPRIIGYLAKGIGFQTTSSSQYNDCNSGAAVNRFMGTALLALNTVNRNNIRVSWKSETLLPGDGNGTPATPRIWNLRLQFRIGSSGDFTDLPGPVEFVAGLATGDSVTIGPTLLPLVCNGKPLVQLRWIYFESSAGSGGTRPRIRLDDISVQSDYAVGLPEDPLAEISIYPNPAGKEFFIHYPSVREGLIRIMDQPGKLLMELPFNGETSRFDCSSLPSGLYLVQITSRDSMISQVSKLIIRK